MPKMTPRQCAAVAARAKYVCVEAGAGSGKTLVLVERILDIIERDGVNLDDIVAITFTDKAAAEMKDRLRRAFHAKAPPDDPARMTYWRALERRVESARITTIHSFCSSLLRENALSAGADPDFAVLSDAEASLLRNEIAERALHGLLDAGDAAAMRAAVALGPRDLRDALAKMLGKRAVLESPGAFDEVHDPEALARRWKEFVMADYERRLSALKDSREAARLLGDLAFFDGACVKTSDKREGMRREMIAALAELRSGAPRERVEVLLKSIVEMSPTGTRASNWSSPEVHGRLKTVQDAVKAFAKSFAAPQFDDALESQAAALTCDFRRTWECVAQEFEAAKAARVSVDFDNQILDARAMLRDHESIRARVARGIRHLLVDEFQDTDPEQLDIIRLLAECPGGPDVFIVGDAKQSIYYFRGAEVELFQEEKDRAREVVSLEENFRATPEVLHFVNDFFSRSNLLDAVEPMYRPIAPSRKEMGGCRVEFLVPHVAENARAADYRAQEATLIAWRISGLCDDATAVWDETTQAPRPASFGAIAILLRAMGDVYVYEQALRQRGIPYQVVAGSGFYERQEILDLHNLLKVLVDPWDSVALLGFLRGPLAGLSDESLLRLCETASVVAAFRATAIPEGFDDEQSERLNRARALVADLRSRAEMPLPAFIRHVLERTCYEAILLSQFLGVQKASNVRKLVELANDFAHASVPRLSAFVRYLDDAAGHEELREGDAALQPESGGAVTLMTIHKAKGLEFPIVFVPDCSRRLRSSASGSVAAHRTLGLAAKIAGPNGESMEPAVFELIKRDRGDRERAEDARILYVAMTRARDRLFLSGAPDARRGTWLRTLDDAYGVLGTQDGGAIRGNDWEAAVRRTPSAGSVSRAAYSAKPLPSRSELEARAAAPPLPAPTRRAMGVTALLNAMGYGFEPHENEERDAAETAFESGAMLRGNLVHRLFEEWDARDIEGVIARIVRCGCGAPSERDALTAYLRGVASRFAASSLAQYFEQGAGTLREVPFLLRMDDFLLHGTIDALLADGTLIDYKTGQPDPAKQERYDAQLCLYAAAAERLSGTRPARALLYYADSGAIHEADVSSARAATVLDRAREAIAEVYGRAS